MQAQAARCSPSGLEGAPPARQKQVREFQQRVEAGPIYKELLLRLGEPERCGAKLDGENIAVSYAFRNEAHLDASISPGIEYSEQHAQFRGLDGEKGARAFETKRTGFLRPRRLRNRLEPAGKRIEEGIFEFTSGGVSRFLMQLPGAHPLQR